MSAREPRRALILAGGGLKVAAQAGVLQVWLDEAGVEFHLADGASGGVFNLAMWCQGKSGTQIAQAWRDTNPLSWLWFSATPWRSISSLERFENNVLPRWGIDWDAIASNGYDATFNVYNFTRQQLETFSPAEMNTQRLLAGVTLPTWFPQQVIDGDVYIDSVYATDANLESAIHRGANELWIIWTMSKLGAWRNGWINQYFQTIQTSANSRLAQSLARIEKLNACRKPDDRIEVKILAFEVPMHYIFIFSSDTLHEAVELGVQQARKWCDANGISRRDPAPRVPDRTSMRFTETMQGFVGAGATDPIAGEQLGREQSSELAVRFRIDVDGLKQFLVDPEHRAMVTGTVSGGFVGGPRPATGTFEQFVYGEDPSWRRMVYSIDFVDASGEPFRLEGEKRLPDVLRLFRPWRDTTTLFTRLVRVGDGQVVAAGILTMSPLAFLRQLLTFRARGGRRSTLVLRYFAFFLGVCGRIYLRRKPQPR